MVYDRGMSNLFILKDGQPEPVDFFEWFEWVSEPDNVLVDYTQIDTDESVCTSFLGLPHPAGLFEVAVGGASFDGAHVRCRTAEKAQQAHKTFMQMCMNTPKGDQ